MGIEIERKFLIRDTTWRRAVRDSTEIRQGYLAAAQTSSVRVRIQALDANLNIKSAESGMTRQEFEYPIPLDDAQDMLDRLCLPGVIHKHRHIVESAGQLWEIDEFHEENEGLIVAEIELESTDAPIERPAWLGREVTDFRRYYNHALAEHPYAQWSEQERLQA